MEIDKVSLGLSSTSQVNFREGVINLEEQIKNIEGAVIGDSEECPLKHLFSDDMYVREIFIPKGMLIVGKIHKHKHPNFLMKGRVRVVTDKGEEFLEAPLSMISPAGTKRALYAETDLIWVTVHSNLSGTRDMDVIEEDVIANSFEDYDKFINNQKTLGYKTKSLIIKKLTKWLG